MKKFTKILCICCLFLLTGCDLYVNNIISPEDKENSSNLTDNSSGTNIIRHDINYSGAINYTSTIPLGNNKWNTIYNEVLSSVVIVRNIVNKNISALGSGVFFAEDSVSNGYAYIYTNAHVVSGAQEVEIVLHNDVTVNGDIVGYDTNEDVAIIRIEKRSDYSIATLRKSDTLQIGERVLAVGTPISEKYSFTATDGIISNLNIDVTEEGSSVKLYLIQTDAALNPGNSGGPLFDNDGNLIGINTIKITSSGSTEIESFNFAIPISHFSLVGNYLLNGEQYNRPYLNITVLEIKQLTLTEKAYYEIENVTSGLYIYTISTGSCLENKASVGQIIIEIEGTKLNSKNALAVNLLKYAPDDTIELTICNKDGTNIQKVNVTLQSIID